MEKKRFFINKNRRRSLSSTEEEEDEAIEYFVYRENERNRDVNGPDSTQMSKGNI